MHLRVGERVGDETSTVGLGCRTRGGWQRNRWQPRLRCLRTWGKRAEVNAIVRIKIWCKRQVQVVHAVWCGQRDVLAAVHH